MQVYRKGDINREEDVDTEPEREGRVRQEEKKSEKRQVTGRKGRNRGFYLAISDLHNQVKGNRQTYTHIER